VTDPHHTEPDQTCIDTDTGECGRLHTTDIQALRRADSVCFHTLPDGSAHIDALLTTWAHPTPRIFTTAEQRLFPDTGHADRRRRIPVTAAVVGFGQDGRWYERGLPAAIAFAMIHAAGLDDVWCSIVGFLRTGDVLSLRWRAGNNNQYLREADLHRDELRLAIRRGQRGWTFLVDIATGPDNTARMIRWGPA